MKKHEVLELISGNLASLELEQHKLRRIHEELSMDRITPEKALIRMEE